MHLPVQFKTIFRSMSIALLAFIGGSACFGGGLLILDPSGQILGLSLSLLQTTRFDDYLIPGIVLFGVIGVGSFLVMTAVIRTIPAFPFLVAADGAVVTVWIVIQIVLIETVLPQQLIIGFIGLLLLGLGVLQWNHHTPER
jgi:hypothetical protein